MFIFVMVIAIDLAIMIDQVDKESVASKQEISELATSNVR